MLTEQLEQRSHRARTEVRPIHRFEPNQRVGVFFRARSSSDSNAESAAGRGRAIPSKW